MCFNVYCHRNCSVYAILLVEICDVFHRLCNMHIVMLYNIVIRYIYHCHVMNWMTDTLTLILPTNLKPIFFQFLPN